MNSNKKLLIAVFSIILISLFSFKIKLSDRYFEIIKNLDIFTTLYKELNTYYVDEINPTDLMEIGIEAMLESLDPYTNFIPEDRIEDYRIMSTGQYGGIGTAMGKFDGRNIVLMAFEGSPAEKAGIKIGDEIIAIDKVDIREKDTDEINTLLKGQIGTSLDVTVKRYGEKKPLKFTVDRARINVESVPYYGLIEEDIAYIRLTEFSSGAGSDVRRALIELKDKGAKKVILDLRGNGGGLLNESIEVSNVFVPKGYEIVSTKGKIEEWNKSYTATKNPLDVNIPLVVLINNGSASASEIVSGVIQDYDRGVLVGQKSFGKGLVQATRPLSYNSQLKLTTAKYYIPSGRSIQAIDYSHRNEDGSIGQIPDSLKSPFKTKSGRVVYDGGGISPDSKVEDEGYAPITVQLIKNGFIFDFATTYYYKNQENIPDPKTFEIPEQLFKEFTIWLENKNYHYYSDTERMLSKLKEQSKKDKFHEFIDDELANLEKEIQNHKSEDVQVFQEEIKSVLKEEIISRFHKRQGMIEASFESDIEVVHAVEILNNEIKYKELLKAN
ncbi:S41 family peptidase [Marivirga sp. S37H4]|uniref:S41 family peptidase n=1 Tax=Marivirga aurantiaca TaxID=2802615 RepID=A0A934X1B8_9BACT|nr:S41 family peptidase [Marivirga aurantiaca]MBK6266672.1 S41 family peptidase [Marivirga aurantiaca]